MTSADVRVLLSYATDCEYSYICWRQINVFDYLLPPRSLLGLIHNRHYVYCVSFQMPKILPQKHIWGSRISDTETAFYLKVTLANLYIVSKIHLWWKSNLSQTVNYPNLRRYLEKAMAPHSSTLAWKIPWMEEPGGLQSLGSLGVGHN